MVCVNKRRNTSTPATATAVAHLVSRVILSARHMQSFCIAVHIYNSTLSVRKTRRTILVAQESSGLISQNRLWKCCFTVWYIFNLQFDAIINCTESRESVLVPPYLCRGVLFVGGWARGVSEERRNGCSPWGVLTMMLLSLLLLLFLILLSLLVFVSLFLWGGHNNRGNKINVLTSLLWKAILKLPFSVSDRQRHPFLNQQ